MHWEMVIALIISIPVILFPAAYLWYMNIGGIFSFFKEAKARRIIQAGGAVDINISTSNKQDS